MNSNQENKNVDSTISGEVVEGFVAPITIGEVTIGQPDLLLSVASMKELKECIAILSNQKQRVPQVARAIATIEREGYHAYCNGGIYSDANTFIQKVFGFDRTYIYRMKKYGKFLFDADIPAGKEPAETAVREILKECFSDKDRKKLFSDAQKICFNRKNKLAEGSSVPDTESSETNAESSADVISESEDVCAAVDTEMFNQCVPEARDFREALKNFKKASDKIYFPQLDNKVYPKDTTFSAILQDNTEKIKSVRTVIACFQHYKAVTKMAIVDAETERSIRAYVDNLIKEAKDEMEELFQKPSSAAAVTH